MPQAVEGVKRERQRDERLDRHLQRSRQRAEGSSQDGALKVPAECRGDEVCQREDVQAAGQGGAGDAVERGRVPGYLWAVDGEVGGHGAVETLFGEDVVVVGLVCGLGGGWSAMRGER